MLGRSLLPECKVIGVTLVALAVELAGVGYDVVEVSSRQLAVVVVVVVLLDIEIDRAIRLVGISGIPDTLHKLNLLDDMTRSVGLNRGRKNIQLVHCTVVTLGVVVCNLHRLQLLQTSLLCDFILAFVGIVLQMSHVSDVAHVAHLISFSS